MASATVTTQPAQELTEQELKATTEKLFTAKIGDRKNALGELKALAVKKTTQKKEQTLKNISDHLKELSNTKVENKKDAEDIKDYTNKFLVEMLFLSFRNSTDTYLTGKNAALMFNFLYETKLLINFQYSLFKKLDSMKNAGRVAIQDTEIWREKLDDGATDNKMDQLTFDIGEEIDKDAFLLCHRVKGEQRVFIYQLKEETVQGVEELKHKKTECTTDELLKHVNENKDQLGAIVSREGFAEFGFNLDTQQIFMPLLFKMMKNGALYQNRASFLMSFVKSLRLYRKGEFSKMLTQPYEFDGVNPLLVKEYLAFMISMAENIDNQSNMSFDLLEDGFKNQTTKIQEAQRELKEFTGAKMSNILNGVVGNLNAINQSLASNTIDTSGKTYDERKQDGTLTESERRQAQEDEKNERKEGRLAGYSENSLAVGADALDNFGKSKEDNKKAKRMGTNGAEIREVQFGEKVLDTQFTITSSMIQSLAKGSEMGIVAVEVMQSKKKNTVDSKIVEALSTVYLSLSTTDKRFLEMALVATYRGFLPSGGTLQRATARNESQQKTFNANKQVVMQYFNMVKESCSYTPGWHQVDRALESILASYAQKMPDISTTVNAASPLIFFKSNGLQLAILGYIATKVLLLLDENTPLDIGVGTVENITDMEKFVMTPMKAFYLASQHNLAGSVKGDKRDPKVQEEQRKMQYITKMLVIDCLNAAGLDYSETDEVADLLRALRVAVQMKKRVLTNTRKSVTPRALTFKADGFNLTPTANEDLKTFFKFFNSATDRYNNGAGPVKKLLQLGTTEEERKKNNEEMKKRAEENGNKTTGISSLNKKHINL